MQFAGSSEFDRVDEKRRRRRSSETDSLDAERCKAIAAATVGVRNANSESTTKNTSETNATRFRRSRRQASRASDTPRICSASLQQCAAYRSSSAVEFIMHLAINSISRADRAPCTPCRPGCSSCTAARCRPSPSPSPPCNRAAWPIARSDSPGRESRNTYSMTTEPVRIPATAGPRNETTGSIAPFKACRSTTARVVKPLA